MFAKFKKYLFETDYLLLAAVLCLAGIGIVSIYSAGYNPYTGETDAFYKRQFMWLVLGIISFFVMSYINYRKVVRLTPVIYSAGIILLLIVLILGHIKMGAQRWIGIGSFRIQPSEIFKIIWVISLAWLFMDFDGKRLSLFKIVQKSWMLIIPFLLVFSQPDLGTALTYVAVWGMLLLMLGVQRNVFIIALIAVAIIVPIGWQHLHDYQQTRVKVFLGLVQDKQGDGYHAEQSKVAGGSGGINGKGFLGGTQAHLSFLPESHTDFIYSVINEEHGLIGGTVVILLFLFLIFKIFSIAVKTKEASGKLIAMAVGCYIFFQFIINAGMTVGMVPIVGIPMPFVSYGGTSLLSFFTMVGIVNSIHLRRYSLTD